MIRRQARTKRTYALFPYTTLFRSGLGADVGGVLHSLHRLDHHEAHDLAVHLCWGRLVEVHPGAHGAEAAHALRRVAAGGRRAGRVLAVVHPRHDDDLRPGVEGLAHKSEKPRVGKEGVSTFRSRWVPYHLKKHNKPHKPLTPII